MDIWPFEVSNAWSLWTTHRKSTAGSRMVTWLMTTCDPKRLRSWPHYLWGAICPLQCQIDASLMYNKTHGDWRHRPLLGIFSSHFLKLGNILWTSGRQFPITTSTPVTISVILNLSHLDARSLIQAERNEKAFRRIQKKMMHSRNTFDWSQSNNISC